MFSTIDWRRPWLQPFHRIAQGVGIAHDWRAACNHFAAGQGLLNHRALPIRFVDQAELPHQMAYETFISETGQVPTRDNLHDFFNAMVWLRYPRSKVLLNRLQAAEITRQRQAEEQDKARVLSVERGRVRDRATIFDENAAILLSSDASIEAALRAHQWDDLLIAQRLLYDKTWEINLFGHALIEKLVNPFKAITAHVWVLQVESAFFCLNIEQKAVMVDQMINDRLLQGWLELAPTPLPVLGVPGWWPYQTAVFYADTTVFRPKPN